jgi:integrase
MTTRYLRGKRWFVGVPTRTGCWIKRATGTADSGLARAIARMLDELGPEGRREWTLLDAVAENRVSVADLYDAYSANDLDGLRARLVDCDLSELVAPWLDALRARVAPDTAKTYALYVRSLIPEGGRFPRSTLTYQKLTQWLATRPVGRSTKRKYHAAMSVFCEYLRGVGALERNPMRDVRAPAAAPPRMRYLALDQMRALIDAQAEPYRTLSALLHGSGMEVSVALALKRRDVEPERREIRARGTKTKARDRQVKVAEWAWPYVHEHVRALLPNALLFPGVNRWTASDKHRDACKALGIEDYQLKDSRHSYAVRAIRAGAHFEHIAQQLGHVDTTMVVKVYGRFRPSEAERTDWERIATAQDEAARAAK